MKNATDFLRKSHTCYHAAENGALLLRATGFVDIDDASADKQAKGYYRVVGGSLFAVRIGNEKMQLVLSHTDSPALRIRYTSDAKTADSPVLLDAEKYGGGLLRSYLDRKLKIAGRVIIKENGVLQGKTVCSDFNAVIPSVAVHLGGGDEELTVARDLRPFVGSLGELYAALGVSDAVGGDLFCVPADEPFYAGVNNEYLCSPRIDNLVSVYASLRAVAACRNKATCVIGCFNGEETGSETREGAQSGLLLAFLHAVYARLGKAYDDQAIEHAFALSCDGAHALHPARKEKYAESAPVLGGGVVIKRNDRYATDALTAATAREIFAQAGLRTQTYYHHADLRCGSTIGLMASRHLGCAVCDIGVGQLAMHSALETAAVCDIDDLIAGLTAFFEKEVFVSGDKIAIE